MKNETDRVFLVGNWLALPPDLSFVHDVLYVSMLRKSEPETSSIVQLEDVPIQDNVSYDKVSAQVVNRNTKSVHNHEISLVNVLWTHHETEEVTWELESNVMDTYPYLFTVPS